jgi:hypothetical protein
MSDQQAFTNLTNYAPLAHEFQNQSYGFQSQQTCMLPQQIHPHMLQMFYQFMSTQQSFGQPFTSTQNQYAYPQEQSHITTNQQQQQHSNSILNRDQQINTQFDDIPPSAQNTANTQIENREPQVEPTTPANKQIPPKENRSGRKKAIYGRLIDKNNPFPLPFPFPEAYIGQD